MTSKKSNVKKRNWAFVLYPESAPDNWIEILQKTGLQCAISPLHDKDIDPTGEPKKAHYHIILCYSGPTSFNVVKTICDSLNQPIPQALEQVRGYYRYLTHKDNPEKYQYADEEIRTINGFNISDFIELSKSEVLEIKKKLQELIRTECIIEYSDFMDYLLDNGMSLEYEVGSNNTYFFEKYISSKRNKFKNMRVNEDTGELE
jgi:hypothetical protein